MVDLSIVIVSYNTKEFLKKCLESIVQSVSEKIRYEIIVVDNNSSDNSVEVVKRSFDFAQDKIFIIKNSENFGFSKANNIGVKSSNGKYLLFLNPDTIVRKNIIETMVEFVDSHKDAGAATCRVELPNGTIDDACHRGFPTPWNSFCYFLGVGKLFSSSELLNGYHLGFRDLDKVHEIDACAGAFMLVRKSAGEGVGWWDEDFFWYGEDLDLCYRLKLKNWKIYYIPAVSILHYKGVSGGIKKHSLAISTASKETKLQATRARFEAMRIFYRKHYINKYPKLVTWLAMKGIDTLFTVSS